MLTLEAWVGKKTRGVAVERERREGEELALHTWLECFCASMESSQVGSIVISTIYTVYSETKQPYTLYSEMKQQVM